ncbi:hypothetical protein COLO4_14511 [Corchorus olitorius]|uniref:SAC domain-containing protein n=1 Tax=Corchorus olitorius TaxID=93759 RepID=A0A1R3JRX0_9ROSI|nr:hypothetical protein COLO4_14511 [Corchorus olitorius]
MATINLSPLSTSSSSLRMLSSYPTQNTPTLSFYSRFTPSIFSPSISVRPLTSIKLKPRSLIIASAVKNLSEIEPAPFPVTNEEFAATFPSEAGVYAVFDQNDEVQFIGISRNIAASLFTHKKSVPELCGSVKVGLVNEPDRAALTQAWKSWMEEQIQTTGKVPPGNETGNTTWTRQPAKRKPDLRLTPGRHVQLTVPLQELIDKLVKENKVVAFIKGSRSAPMCGFSQRVIAILESQGVDYETLDVLDEEHNYGLRETLKQYSNWPTFPQVFVNGELVGGCDILTSMYEKGELADASSSENLSKSLTIYGVAGIIRLLAGTYVLVITSRKEVGSFLGFPVYRVESMKFLACNEALRLILDLFGTNNFWRNLLSLSLSFQVAQLKLKDSPVTFTLISRRCTRRLGTRMWRRGANLDGDTANFIETEQLLELEGFRCSLLQIRGSIPLLWEQIVDLSYKPRLRVINHEQTPEVVERHFHDLCQRYGEIIAVDLTDKHGDEGQLSAAYSAEMQKLPNVRYVSFDFHHVCGSSNFDNIHVLYDDISEDFEKQGYFLIGSDGNILEEQKGIIRSNCIDCLDRTNVTQSYLAQKSLDIQLRRIGVFSSTESISMFTEDYGKFRTLWAEQGDEISLEYAGTHALKGDLVRYGKQTVAGIIKDGMSALSRYYLNNFHDGIRQDALDLISGRYTVSRHKPSPFQLNSFETLSYLPVASALLLGGLTITSVTIHQAGRNAQQYVTSVVWAGVTAGFVALVKANGRQFCSRPRLCGLL